MLPAKFWFFLSIGRVVSEEKIFFRNQSIRKENIAVAAMFVNGSQLNEHSL